MKILFISHSSVLPTYREKLRLLARHKDLELTLLLPRYWPEAGKRIRTSDQSPSQEGYRILSAPILFEGRIKRHFYPFFQRYIDQVRPDLIHIEEEPYSLVAWQSIQASQQLGIPHVFFTWENLLERFPFPHQAIRQKVLQNSAHAIVGDKEAADLLKRSGISPKKISVIPQYGVDPRLFQRKNVSHLKKRLNLSAFTIGYVGRLVAEKGLTHLLEAFHDLNHSQATLLLVGNGPLKAVLEAQASRLSISDRIRWVPSVDRTQIPDYLNYMDVLVLPSLTTSQWKEQFGRVIIEAQACEVPVVGSDSGAIPEVIGPAGLIYAEGNSKELKKKLHQLAQSKTLCAQLGKKGRDRVLKHFTDQKIADQIYGIYRKLLPKKPIRHRP